MSPSTSSFVVKLGVGILHGVHAIEMKNAFESRTIQRNQIVSNNVDPGQVACTKCRKKDVYVFGALGHQSNDTYRA
jgi:hypothetical protein